MSPVGDKLIKAAHTLNSITCAEVEAWAYEAGLDPTAVSRTIQGMCECVNWLAEHEARRHRVAPAIPSNREKLLEVSRLLRQMQG